MSDSNPLNLLPGMSIFMVNLQVYYGYSCNWQQDELILVLHSKLLMKYCIIFVLASHTAMLSFSSNSVLAVLIRYSVIIKRQWLYYSSAYNNYVLSGNHIFSHLAQNFHLNKM